MLNVKKLQAIRDKILGVTVNPRTYGDLNSVVYLQQILDALKGTNPLNVHGNLNEKIYLQKIRNAIRGVADGQFGSLSNTVYLQQILNAFNGVADGQFGSLSQNTYLDAISAVAKPVSSSLLTGLAAYWKFNETVVTGAEPAVDSVAGLTLTHTNNPLSAAGILGNARAFVLLSSQILSVVNPPVLRFTGDFSISFWVKFTSVVNQDVMNRYSGADRCFAITVSGQRLRFLVGRDDNPGASVTVTDANFGNVGTGIWYHVYCWCRSSVEIGIRINDAAQTTASFAGFTPNPGTRNFSISYNAIANFMNGAVDELGFWSRLLTAAERAILYNAGVGKTYPF